MGWGGGTAHLTGRKLSSDLQTGHFGIDMDSICSTLKMEAACFVESFVSTYKTTLCHTPNGYSLNYGCFENANTHIYVIDTDI